MYRVAVLEAGLLKGRCAQGHAPSLTCREILLRFFVWLAGLLWSSLACSCISLISAFVITWHFPCASLSSHPFIMLPVRLNQGPAHVDLTFHICSDPISQKVRSLRYWGLGFQHNPFLKRQFNQQWLPFGSFCLFRRERALTVDFSWGWGGVGFFYEEAKILHRISTSLYIS